MMDVLQSVSAFIFAIGLLVIFHELGHFLVAQKYGVKVLTFSIGFGKPIWTKCFGKDRTKLVIAAIPLGGYVRMLDERDDDVADDELHRTFNRKTIAQRSAIILAGPLFNFIFAIVVFWLMFMLGLVGLKPWIGNIQKGSIADRAGFSEGMEIIAVDSENIRTWSMVNNALLEKIGVQDNVDITVLNNSIKQRLDLNIVDLSLDEFIDKGVFNALGMEAKRLQIPAIVGKVFSQSPAARSGIISGDRIISVDRKKILHWEQFVKYIRVYPEQKMTLEILREEEYLTVFITPAKKMTDTKEVIGYIGISPLPIEDSSMLRKESYMLVPAFFKSIEKTWNMSWFTLRMFGNLIVGLISPKNLSGPIKIAQHAGIAANNGIASFLWFLGAVSISLGVLNLLPIPLLDGGHLLYYAIELCTGNPVPESAYIIGQQIGIVLLSCVMLFTVYIDILHLLT